MSEPQDEPDLDAVVEAEDDGWPPPCVDKRGHSWVVQDAEEGWEGRSYCEWCGVDGDG
jgi:hypothetical protein